MRKDEVLDFLNKATKDVLDNNSKESSVTFFLFSPLAKMIDNKSDVDKLLGP